jgi:hypothetical protein
MGLPIIWTAGVFLAACLGDDHVAGFDVLPEWLAIAVGVATVAACPVALRAALDALLYPVRGEIITPQGKLMRFWWFGRIVIVWDGPMIHVFLVRHPVNAASPGRRSRRPPSAHASTMYRAPAEAPPRQAQTLPRILPVPQHPTGAGACAVRKISRRERRVAFAEGGSGNSPYGKRGHVMSPWQEWSTVA